MQIDYFQKWGKGSLHSKMFEKTLIYSLEEAMMKMFGATVPPENGGGLRTNNSNTGNSDRYCIHDVKCRHYKKSKASSNTVNFETDSIENMEAYLNGLRVMPGGIQRCGVCCKKQ